MENGSAQKLNVEYSRFCPINSAIGHTAFHADGGSLVCPGFGAAGWRPGASSFSLGFVTVAFAVGRGSQRPFAAKRHKMGRGPTDGGGCRVRGLYFSPAGLLSLSLSQREGFPSRRLPFRRMTRRCVPSPAIGPELIGFLFGNSHARG